jgi:hypothetical protein
VTTLAVNTSLASVTAPVLSLPTAAKNGSNAYTGTVTTDKTGGTLFHVVTTSATQPSVAQIEAGQDHTGSAAPAKGALTPVAAGLRNVSGSGLTAETTYYIHYVQTGTFNDSNRVVSASFTTDAIAAGTGTVTISIDRQMNEMVAPAYVQLNIGVTGASVSEPGTDTYDPTFNELVYVTTWDDPGAESTRVTNIADAHNNLNVSYSKMPAHVYKSPGSYTITTHVYELDGTFVGTDTQAVTVSDPDTVYSGSRTILVDPAGVGDSSTYPSSQVATTLSAALALVNNEASTHRIFIKAGASLDIDADMVLGSTYPNVYIGRYGGTTPYTLNLSSTFVANETNGTGDLFYLAGSFDSDFVIWGGEAIGDWDDETETGKQFNCISIEGTNDTRRVLIHDMLLDGWAITVEGKPGSNDKVAVCVHDTQISGWGNYGIVTESDEGYWSVIGSRIESSENAMMGGFDKNFDANQHGPIRSFACERVLLDATEFFSRTTWVSNLVSQPCIRGKAVAGSKRIKYVVTRCSLEGGGNLYTTDVPNGSITLSDADTLVEKNLMVGSAWTYNFIALRIGGVTVRNNILIMPNVPRITTETGGNIIGWDTAFSAQSAGNPYSQSGSPNRFYNNTVLLLTNDTNLGGPNTLNLMEGTLYDVLENNAFDTPNSSGSWGQEAIDVSTTQMATVGGTWVPKFLGAKWRDSGSNMGAQLTMDTAHATPSGIVWNMVPNASSPLVNDATTGKTALDDFYGVVRSGTRDRGAVERP